MKNRIVTGVHHAEQDDIADLITFRALPVLGLQNLNPFIFLNHHGPQNFEENNRGLPFGPHHHRGFETVTIILAGDIAHKDSAGNQSVVMAGGVQWMTAGRGLVHSEVSSEHFLRAGGALEILQLWVNLPARLKMSEPYYLGLQRHNIPVYERDASKIKIQLVSGKWEDNLGPFPTLHPTTIMTVCLTDNAEYEFVIPENEVIFLYVISGQLNVNGSEPKPRSTINFSHDGDVLQVKTSTGAHFLLCHAPRLKEPIASYGPFVMNTLEEIQQAIKDYQSGKIR